MASAVRRRPEPKQIARRKPGIEGSVMKGWYVRLPNAQVLVREHDSTCAIKFV